MCERQSPPRGESFDFVVEYAARQVCQSCSRRSRCWVKGYSCAMDGLYQFKPLLEQTGHADLEHFPGQLSVCEHPADLVEAVNHGYRLWRSRRQTRARASTLRAALTEQYGAMASALAQLSARLGQAGLPDPRRESRVNQLFASIGLEALECSVNADVTGHITAGITVSRTAFTAEEVKELTAEMSRICRRDFALPEIAHCRTVTMLSFTERPLFDVAFGSASRPAEEVSGDACDQFCDGCGRAQMLLCDGMGTGRPAAVDGQLAARLTGQLLRAGFAAESAARLANVAMGLKNGDQESGATLDLLTVDLFTGRAGTVQGGGGAQLSGAKRRTPHDGGRQPAHGDSGFGGGAVVQLHAGGRRPAGAGVRRGAVRRHRLDFAAAAIVRPAGPYPAAAGQRPGRLGGAPGRTAAGRHHGGGGKNQPPVSRPAPVRGLGEKNMPFVRWPRRITGSDAARFFDFFDTLTNHLNVSGHAGRSRRTERRRAYGPWCRSGRRKRGLLPRCRGAGYGRVPPPEATEKYFLPFSMAHFL